MHSRVIRLESTTALRKVGSRHLGLKLAGAGRQERVLAGHRVDGVAHPGVPARLNLGGVVVVLGVLDPAGAEGQLVAIFEELVAGAVGAY